jgi:hypothetical protein
VPLDYRLTPKNSAERGPRRGGGDGGSLGGRQLDCTTAFGALEGALGRPVDRDICSLTGELREKELWVQRADWLMATSLLGLQ